MSQVLFAMNPLNHYVTSLKRALYGLITLPIWLYASLPIQDSDPYDLALYEYLGGGTLSFQSLDEYAHTLEGTPITSIETQLAHAKILKKRDNSPFHLLLDFYTEGIHHKFGLVYNPMKSKEHFQRFCNDSRIASYCNQIGNYGVNPLSRLILGTQEAIKLLGMEQDLKHYENCVHSKLLFDDRERLEILNILLTLNTSYLTRSQNNQYIFHVLYKIPKPLREPLQIHLKNSVNRKTVENLAEILGHSPNSEFPNVFVTILEKRIAPMTAKATNQVLDKINSIIKRSKKLGTAYTIVFRRCLVANSIGEFLFDRQEKEKIQKPFWILLNSAKYKKANTQQKEKLLLDMLEKKGSSAEWLKQRDQVGNNLLHKLGELPTIEVVKKLLKTLKKKKLLDDMLYEVNREGNTPVIKLFIEDMKTGIAADSMSWTKVWSLLLFDIEDNKEEKSEKNINPIFLTSCDWHGNTVFHHFNEIQGIVNEKEALLNMKIMMMVVMITCLVNKKGSIDIPDHTQKYAIQNCPYQKLFTIKNTSGETAFMRFLCCHDNPNFDIPIINGYSMMALRGEDTLGYYEVVQFDQLHKMKKFDLSKTRSSEIGLVYEDMQKEAQKPNSPYTLEDLSELVAGKDHKSENELMHHIEASSLSLNEKKSMISFLIERIPDEKLMFKKKGNSATPTILNFLHEVNSWPLIEHIFKVLENKNPKIITASFEQKQSERYHPLYTWMLHLESTTLSKEEKEKVFQKLWSYMKWNTMENSCNWLKFLYKASDLEVNGEDLLTLFLKSIPKDPNENQLYRFYAFHLITSSPISYFSSKERQDICDKITSENFDFDSFKKTQILPEEKEEKKTDKQPIIPTKSSGSLQGNPTLIKSKSHKPVKKEDLPPSTSFSPKGFSANKIILICSILAFILVSGIILTLLLFKKKFSKRHHQYIKSNKLNSKQRRMKKAKKKESK